MTCHFETSHKCSTWWRSVTVKAVWFIPFLILMVQFSEPSCICYVSWLFKLFLLFVTSFCVQWGFGSLRDISRTFYERPKKLTAISSEVRQTANAFSPTRSERHQRSRHRFVWTVQRQDPRTRQRLTDAQRISSRLDIQSCQGQAVTNESRHGTGERRSQAGETAERPEPSCNMTTADTWLQIPVSRAVSRLFPRNFFNLYFSWQTDSSGVLAGERCNVWLPLLLQSRSLRTKTSRFQTTRQKVA